MTYNVDKLLTEAAEAGLYVQFFEHRYWRECHELQWCCWIRSKSKPDMAKKGEGTTAGEAINEALNKALTFDPLPEIKITGYTQSLDQILKGVKPLQSRREVEKVDFNRRGL